jgi:two-component system NtrC family sensor kinase
MDSNLIRILLVEDSPTDVFLLRDALAEVPSVQFKVIQAERLAEALQRLDEGQFDVILSDLGLPDSQGLETFVRMHAQAPDTPIVVLTAMNDEDLALRAMQEGAQDYLVKGQTEGLLLMRSIRYAIERQRAEGEIRRLNLEAIRSAAEKEVAEVRAAMAEKLEENNRELAETNRRLKETQAHLIQSEKMASLGQLVAGIAHELNNPLAFIRSNVFTIETWLSQIKAQVEPHLTPASAKNLEKVRTRLSDMQEGLDRVKDLVLKLRTFSRLDEGEFKTVDVHESLDSVLLFLRHRTKGRILVEKDYCADGTLSCYASQLTQVFMNLVANAVEAIEGQGKITITTRRSDAHFSTSVRDTGKGIPEAILHRIFEPFFTTKPVGQGTGLGLAISYGIVLAHQGTIEIHNREEGGTEFLVKIPLGLKGESGP